MIKKTILITGSSSGIGWSTAEKLATKGHHLILCGRNLNKLEELSNKLNTNTHILTFDVRNKEDVFKSIGGSKKV